MSTISMLPVDESTTRPGSDAVPMVAVIVSCEETVAVSDPYIWNCEVDAVYSNVRSDGSSSSEKMENWPFTVSSMNDTTPSATSVASVAVTSVMPSDVENWTEPLNWKLLSIELYE